MPYEKGIVRLMTAGAKEEPVRRIRLTSHPLTRALKRCGTVHIYADTADIAEIEDVAVEGRTSDSVYLYSEIDGNTTNQALMRKVFDHYVELGDEDNVANWVRLLLTARPSLSLDEAVVTVYSIINARLGLELLNHFQAERSWNVSLELHTALASDAARSKGMAYCLNRAVPESLVKVAFSPERPQSLLVARDLENLGIPVNFTTLFSARQVAAAALLANPHRSSIFIGRLNQGLESALLGEHVALKAQRHLSRIRADFGVKTLNLIASIRRWQSFVLTAGCDSYTSPCGALKNFMTQTMLDAEVIENRTEEDYSKDLGISGAVQDKIGLERIKRLYVVEPEFIEFLTALRASKEFLTIDEERLYRRFDAAGFGDFFYAPSTAEWRELRKSKLPNLDSPLSKRIAMDTLYSLLAIGDFTNSQDEMDQLIRDSIEPFFARPTSRAEL